MANFRAKKAGMALHIQKEHEAKYNAEEALGTPERLVEWLNSVMNGDHPPCSGSTWRKMQFFLRDGTVLCKLVNKLRTSDGMSAVKFQKYATTPFVAMENIDIFNKAAVDYGITPETAFQSVDLYEGQKSTFLKVINCLNKLGFVANQKGFTPAFDAVAAPEMDSDRS